MILHQASRGVPDGVRLGQGVSLLHAPGAPGPWGLAAPARPPLRQFPAELLPPERGGWRPLRATLHYGAASAAAQVWSCDTVPHRFDPPGSALRTAVLMGGEGPYGGAGEVLGVPAAEGRGYLVFELRRVDGRAEHEATARPARRPFDRMWHLTPEWRKAGTRLRPGERVHDGDQFDARVGAAEAQRYVEAFYEFGTHFVSAVEAGDALVQVVLLHPGAMDEARDCFRRFGQGGAVWGEASLHLGSFLRAARAQQVGPIVSLAGDPALPAGVARGAWSDPGSRSGTSLLAALDGGRGGLAGLSATAPLRVELTSLSRFLDFYRGLSFERVLRGALMQRWGAGRVELPLRRMPGTERALAETVLHGEPAVVAAGEVTFLHGDRLDLSAASTASRRAGCHRVLSVRGARGSIPLGAGTLLAQLLDAAPACGTAPVLSVPDDRFDGAGIVCGTTAGALLLENESGTRRDAVVDGLRFTDAGPEPDTARPRVRVRGDLHTPGAAGLQELLPCIRAALGRASVTLSSAAPGDAARAGAAAFAEWLAGVLAALPAEPDAQRLRALALYLSRVETGVPAGGANPGAATPPRAGRHLAAISAAAITADEMLRGDAARARRRFSSHPGAADHEGATLAGLRALRRAVSGSYLALLAEGSSRRDRAVRAARAVHDRAAAELARAAAPLREAAAPGSPTEAVLNALLSAPRAGPPQGCGEALRARMGEDAAGAAVEFVAREAATHARAARFQAVDALCTAPAGGAEYQAAEGALGGLSAADERAGDEAPAGSALLRRALRDGVDAGPGGAVDGVLCAWERFEAARSRLAAARGERCRDRVEAWYHAALEPAACEPPAGGAAGPPRLQIQIEQYRLLTTLGQALRRGPAPPDHAAPAEAGAIGHLLALRVDSVRLHAASTTRYL